MIARSLALFVLLLSLGTARAEEAGHVTRLQGSAFDGGRALSTDAVVDEGARLRTLAQSRLEVLFRDGTTIALGPDAEMVVDRYVFDPKAEKGLALFGIPKGAFLVRTGLIAALPDRPLKVATPVATIGIRGTEFWGGPLDHPLDVLVLKGAIAVTTPSNVVQVQAGQGISVPVPGLATTNPVAWPDEKIRRAFETVTFR